MPFIVDGFELGLHMCSYEFSAWYLLILLSLQDYAFESNCKDQVSGKGISWTGNWLQQYISISILQLLLWNRDLMVVMISTVVIPMIIYAYGVSLTLKIWNLLSFIMLLPVTCIYTLEICTCTYQHFKI